MAFDLSTAKPMGSTGGFDLSTAKPMDTAPSSEPMTDREAFESSMPVRVLRGVEGPAISLLKMVGPDSIKQQLAEIDALRKSGMKKRGNEGFDWAGLVGSLVPGGAIASGVTKALPAATTLFGKMGVGAVAGGASAGAVPLEGNNELSTDKLKQMAGGAIVGGAIPAVLQGVKWFFGTNQLNPTQAATMKEGQAAGYVTPPSMANPSGLNNTIESIAGKAAVGQEAAARNQKITNAMTAKALGLPKDQPITPGAIEAVRKDAGKVYEEVAQLSPNAKWALGELKQARHDASVNYTFYNRSGNPDALTKAQQAGQMADMLEGELQNEAAQSGKQRLMQALAEARTKIAKTYDVERALGEADSNVSAPILGRSFDKKGGKAITGELSTIGKMAEAFPSVMREGAKVPTPGVSGTDAAASAILGTLGYGAGGPAGLTAAALPLMRPIARNLVLSKGYQNTLAQGIPARYQPLIDAMTTQAIGAGGTTAGRAY
ncbi:MAG TPA: hypothetical protein VHL08_06710 [Dongiaceae bacterium]|nr:hypothetical protein [Dongiaceae bacterium]